MPDPIRIVFCGTSAFAIPCLQALARDRDMRVDLVISQPDKPVGRKQVLTPPPLKEAALDLGLRVTQPVGINEQAAAIMASVPRPDFLVVVSYGQIISQQLLDWPSRAPVNVHASLLPQWRGASPIQQAILSGQTQTGVTVQRMVQALDAGPALGRRAVTITGRETAHTLHDRLAQAGANLLLTTLKHPLQPVPQDEARATFCRKLKREDGIVDPANMTADEIDRTVRALVPWPGVTMNIDGTNVKILRTDLTEQPDSHPLRCAGETTLYLLEVQPPSRKPMSGKAWAMGRQKKAEDRE